MDLRRFYELDPRRSRALLLRTVLALLVAWSLCFAPLPAWSRLPLGVLVGGLLLRCCSFAHDWAHGAILARDPWGRALCRAIAVVVLAPVRIWADTHHPHHARNGILREPSIGTLPLWTIDEYRAASPLLRRGYRFLRSPYFMLLSWPAVFIVGLNVVPLLRSPWKYRSSALALALHAGLHAFAWWQGGPTSYLAAVVVPYTVLGAVGGYLFYVQHNYPGARWWPRAEWSRERAALSASSYMAMSPLSHWFTGNIGYHHIHHLDARIPFYRLPEVFEAVPELRREPDTSWRPRDLRRAFDLAAWDGERITSWREAAG